tara:strand:- start:642 stop:1301 length:660 start_codon:yes stop_codon:yes gene_type:complete
MTSCFKKPNKKYLSAKDYTIKKRRKTIFCNLRNNFKNNVDNSIFVKQGNNVVCLDNNGVMNKYNNHETGLDMLAAFEDFRDDLNKYVTGQIFKNHFCPPYDISSNNYDISNNYFQNNVQLAFGEGASPSGIYGHLTTYFGGLNNDIISTHTSNTYRNTYAEIKPGSNDNDDSNNENGRFKNNKFLLLKPSACDNKTRPQVLVSSDISGPLASSIEIIIT